MLLPRLSQTYIAVGCASGVPQNRTHVRIQSLNDYDISNCLRQYYGILTVAVCVSCLTIEACMWRPDGVRRALRRFGRGLDLRALQTISPAIQFRLKPHFR